MPKIDNQDSVSIEPVEKFDQPRIFNQTRDQAACGVSMEVNFPIQNEHGEFIAVRNHPIVEDGLKNLFHNEHRAGYNDITGESDGAGVQFTGGIPTQFFNKKIAQGAFITVNGETLKTAQFQLQEGQTVIGNYFLPKEPQHELAAKNLIAESAAQNSLRVIGWRNLNGADAVDDNQLSAGALKKKPNMWQAIFLPISAPDEQTSFNLERAALQTTKKVAYLARQRQLKINTCSLSGESMVFKGMIRPIQMPAYFKDFSDPDFTAVAVSSHARFATNTEPDPSRAQPCEEEEIDHNGELNSKLANQVEMRNEAAHYDFEEGEPNPSGSDSMQFTADVANQMLLKDVPKYEAIIRLMPPRPSADYSSEINAMLSCFQLERTPYDGPAFLTGNKAGYYFAKLDACALRPGRWGITRDKNGQRKFYAASEDTLIAPEGGEILETGNLDAGGMVMLTPKGEVLHTKKILQLIRKRYSQEDPQYFQKLLTQTLVPLITPAITKHSEDFPKHAELNRILYAKGWDYEAIEQVLRHMADHASERIGSMGDDTNILHSTALPGHLSAFFHQLFAQVSAPPQDSVNEPENFSLETTLGPAFGGVPGGKIIKLESPILDIDDLYYLKNHPDVPSFSLDMSYELDPTSTNQAAHMREAIKQLLIAAEKAAQTPGGGVLIISDKNKDPGRIAIPDLIAVAAVRKHLENKKLLRNISIVADSYQISGPHQSAALLALGADAVYARGAYAKINQLYEKDAHLKAKNYRKATEKCLLKTMGKMGLVNVKNYKGFVAALGLDLADSQEYALEDHPTLANIFPTIYSPLRGINLSHIADHLVIRHQLAEDTDNDFTLMPHSGHFMPEKGGIKHGYGPVVINAFTEWMKKEEIDYTLWRLHSILEKRGFPRFVSDATERFTPENGFLDENQKEQGRYPVDYLARFKASSAFKEMMQTLEQYQKEHPTSIRSNFVIKPWTPTELRQFLELPENSTENLQSTADIRALFHAGNMSLGALTEPAHRSLRRGMKSVGAFSAAGEGGEDPDDLRDEFETTSSKQIASGRFGVNTMQILMAEEIEIKVAQGAKPGEGGQLPSKKVSVQIAALRGGMPWTNIISPPPHHDIYSIEDLEQLIYDIKSVKPSVKVAVKLVASEGIGTIAVGVAKAGADIISIASNDGGTGAAQQSSIKHTGMPSEIGLAEVERDLRRARLRDLVELRMSGGFKTVEDIILATILGADQFELGTTLMITQNCKKQNTCDRSCQPGVAIDGHLFKGKQINTERYIAGLADMVQDRLRELGARNLNELKGRTELLEVLDPELKKIYDFSAILDRSSQCGILQLADSEEPPTYASIQPLLHQQDCVVLFKGEIYFANRCKETFKKVIVTDKRFAHLTALKDKFGEDYYRADAATLALITQATDNHFLPLRLTEQELAKAKQARYASNARIKEDSLIQKIEAYFTENPSGTFESEEITLTPKDRSFGARIAGKFVKHLEANPNAKLILNTSRKAGQSYGFVLPKGMILNHIGGVQDGFGKSASSGEIIITSPGQKAIGGNAAFYGASGVKAYINGSVGHRFGILSKRGVQITVEGTGKSPFEFMLGGTGMILGPVGEGLCGSASGGIVFHYDRYDLCPYQAGVPIEKNKLYIEIQGDSILYKTIDPKDAEKTISCVLNIKNLDPDFTGSITLQKLQPYLEKILAITAEKGHTPKNYADSVRNMWGTERKAYERAIRTMLQEHVTKTQSKKAQEILDSFDLAHFKILIPKSLDNVKTLEQLIDVIATFHASESAISIGEQVWLEQKAQEIVGDNCESVFPDNIAPDIQERLKKLAELLKKFDGLPFSKRIQAKLIQKISPFIKTRMVTDFDLHLEKISTEGFAQLQSINHGEVVIHRKNPSVTQRLSGINGTLDQLLADIMENITAYAAELKHEGTGCSGCRAASCQGGEQVDTGCPSGKKINTINLILQQVGERPKDGPLTKEQWYNIRKALEVQIEESPFIAYTGAACPAPCQSACTETIPDRSGPDAKRGGKLVGEYVHIKSIEYDLFQLGRALGWFSGFANDQKIWTEAEVMQVFAKEGENYEGALKRKQETFDKGIATFKAPFRASEKKRADKKIIIIGSGPAAQQIAFEALRDGLEVEMYEKSDKPGGLVTDGIPAHKFDKTYIKEYFSYLQKMGLKLHLNSEISFDAAKTQFTLKQPSEKKPLIIAEGNDPNTHVALCVGAGQPKDLPSNIVQTPPILDTDSHAEKVEKQVIADNLRKKIIPATHLLKKFNDIAETLSNPEQLVALFDSSFAKLSQQTDINSAELKELKEGDPQTLAGRLQTNTNIYTRLQDMLAAKILKEEDPRGKKIVVIGGGDTAQDVIRWLARYFSMDITQNRGHLVVVIRGPKPVLERGIQDSWPAQSQTPTAEYHLKEEELQYVDGNNQYLVEPYNIQLMQTMIGQKLSVQLKQHHFKYVEAINSDSEQKKAYEMLPRNERPRENSALLDPILNVDMVITALGFQGSDSTALVKQAKEASVTNISLAGDAATGSKLIVTAQNSAKNTYRQMIKPGLGIDKPVSLSKTLKPTTDLSALAANSIFAKSQRSSPMSTAENTLGVSAPTLP